ncbi:hypothetical protein V6R21_08300 [Limibacter armeniacum]|uniref:hypothetical protein n=1 Tax=Limibacter armeniacum TaxID=466084 RepID=UPI002FE554AF
MRKLTLLLLYWCVPLFIGCSDEFPPKGADETEIVPPLTLKTLTLGDVGGDITLTHQYAFDEGLLIGVRVTDFEDGVSVYEVNYALEYKEEQLVKVIKFEGNEAFVFEITYGEEQIEVNAKDYQDVMVYDLSNGYISRIAYYYQIGGVLTKRSYEETFSYDGKGNLLEKTLDYSSDKYVTTYTYDDMINPFLVLGKDHITRFMVNQILGYDGLIVPLGKNNILEHVESHIVEGVDNTTAESYRFRFNYLYNEEGLPSKLIFSDMYDVTEIMYLYSRNELNL